MEDFYYRDGAAFAGVFRGGAKGSFEGFGGGFHVGTVVRDYDRRALTEFPDCDFDASWGEGLYIFDEIPGDLFGVLIGDEAAGDFGHGSGGDYGFLAGAGEAGGDTIDVQAGTEFGHQVGWEFGFVDVVVGIGGGFEF